MQTLAERMRFLRAATGAHATQLSRVAGVSENLVGMYERGDRGARMSLDTALKIAVVTGCDPVWLVSGKGETPVEDAVRTTFDRAAATLPPDERPTLTPDPSTPPDASPDVRAA